MFFRKKENALETTTLFYRQMASLLSAGVSMKDALITLSEENENENVEALITTLTADISTADASGDAMKNYPDFIKKTLKYFIASDKNETVFPKILNTIADDNERIEDLKKRVKTACIYPALLIAMAVVITSVILIFVIPTFSDMFASFGSQLPAPTRFTIDASHFLTNNIAIIVTGLLIIFCVLRYNKNLSHSIINILPGIGSLAKSLSIIRFLKYLSLLLSLKAPLGEAIEYASDSVNNVIYAKKFKALKNRATPDTTLSEILTTTGFFSPMIIRMIKAGEKINATDSILSEVAVHYELKMDSIEKYVQIIDFAIILFTGTVIGGLVISMYLPIFQMAGAVGG